MSQGEIVPGLHRLPGIRGVNAYIWHPRPDQRDIGEPILFDCGWPWSGPRLVTSLVALGCGPADVRTIAITHDDVDHTGRLAPLAAVSGASVVAHVQEAERIAGDVWRELPGIRGRFRLGRAISGLFLVRWPHRPVRVTQPIHDGDALPGGWIAVHTPGHTPGHTAYFHPGQRLLIAGDALGFSTGSRLHFPLRIYTEDAGAAATSIRKLAALEPDVICSGHGLVMTDAARALRGLAESL